MKIEEQRKFLTIAKHQVMVDCNLNKFDINLLDKDINTMIAGSVLYFVSRRYNLFSSVLMSVLNITEEGLFKIIKANNTSILTSILVDYVNKKINPRLETFGYTKKEDEIDIIEIENPKLVSLLEKLWKIPAGKLFERTKKPNYTRARTCYYMYMNFIGFSWSKIAKKHNRDHTTILHARDEIHGYLYNALGPDGQEYTSNYNKFIEYAFSE